MFFGQEVDVDPRDIETKMQRQGGLIDTISTGFSNLFNFAKDKFLELIGIDQSEDALPLYQQFLNKIGLEDSEVAGKSLFVQIMEKLFPPNEANEPLGVRIGNAIIDGLNAFFEGPAGQAMTSTISYYFEGLMLSLQEAIDSKIGILSNKRLAAERAAHEQRGFKEGRLNETDASRVSSEMQENLQRRLNQMSNPYYGSHYDGFGSDEARAAHVMETQQLIDTLRENGISVTIPENLPVRRVGTLKATGKMTEPADTVAQIHKGERVLNPSEAGAVNDLPGAINQLNTLTAQVRDLMAQSVQYQEKTARGIRKLGSDMMA